MKIFKLSLRRIPTAGLVLGILAAAMVWIQAAPAQAAGYDDCGADRLCLYTGSGGTGTSAQFGSTDTRLNYADDAALAGKTVVSVRNSTSYWACLYNEDSYGSRIQAVRPGHAGLDMPTYSSGPQIGTQVVTPSSHKFAKSKAGCFTGYERCKAGLLCIFREPSGRGIGSVTAQTEDLGNGGKGNRDYATTSWDNKVVSVSNRTAQVACFYKDAGYSGTWTGEYRAFVVQPGEETTVPTLYDLDFSSHKLVADEGKC